MLSMRKNQESILILQLVHNILAEETGLQKKFALLLQKLNENPIFHALTKAYGRYKVYATKFLSRKGMDAAYGFDKITKSGNFSLT